MLVCFVEREGLARLISARLVTEKERIDYEKGISIQRKATPELLPEYRFDYAKAKPNRFAGGRGSRVVVVLDPDISEVFKTPESVNTVLRALITTMPSAQKA